MTLLISHMSALDFWRKAYPANRAPSLADALAACELERMLAAGGCAQTEEEAWTNAPAVITPGVLAPERGVLHVTVQDERARNRSRTLHCHCWSDGFPEGAFYQLGEGNCVAAPEFAYLQMARELSVTQLIALGDELCGVYSFDEDCLSGVRQRGVPLTTPGRLAGFLEMVEGRAARGGAGGSVPQGLRKAQRAVAHVVSNSASPMETMLEMLLALPCRMGGYGIPRPLMNHEIRLSGEAAAIARRRSLRADLWWGERCVDLEFNGRAAHSGERAEFSDRARTNALMLMDCTVIEMTSQQLMSFGEFELLALHLAKLLGKRIASSQRGALASRLGLRGELLAWSRAFGRAAADCSAI